MKRPGSSPHSRLRLLLALLFGVGTGASYGQEPGTHGYAVSRGTSISQHDPATVLALQLGPEESLAFRLDGLLSEAFWERTPGLDDLRQREPLEGEPATERTEVRVGYDQRFLYVGVRALDSEPDRVVSRILQRDRLMRKAELSQRPAFAGDDAVAILLDPFHDRRNAYVFATNPNGAEFDALLADEGKEFNVDWRGVWEVAGARTGQGWSAEFRIPLRTVRYPDNSAEPWGFNVYRMIRRKNEEVLWQAWSRDSGGFHRVSLAGNLEGLRGLPATGRNLEVKPYALTGIRQSREEDGALPVEGELEAGLDLKAEVRPGLVLDVTLNTDFAQVEVDDEQVNLTRFGLFFPEKRDFFLENSGIFDFGIAGNPFEPPPFQMFFSRRIGIEEDEDTVVPILGGARLTGRVGGQTVGALSVLTDEVEGLVPRESFSVARVKRDVGDSDYIGLMLTDRRSSDDWNTVVGADAAMYVTPSMNVQAWIAGTFTGGEQGNDLAYAVMADYSTDRWGAFARHLAVGPDAEARLGFIQRTDLRRTDVHGRRSFRPDRLRIRKIDAFAVGNLFAGTRGEMQDWAAGSALSTEFESGDRFMLFLQAGENRPDEEFELADTLTIPAGSYDATGFSGLFATSPSRPATLEGRLTFANFYGGSLRSVGGTVTLAPTAAFGLSLGYNRNAVNTPSGSFTATLSSVRASYSLSTRLTTNLLLQHNSLDEVFSANFRVNFIHRPGSDLFFVVTEERGVDGAQWEVSDRGVILKITYLHRF